MTGFMIIQDIDMGYLVTLGHNTTCRASARGGRLEVLKWLHNTLRLGCPWDTTTSVCAPLRDRSKIHPCAYVNQQRFGSYSLCHVSRRVLGRNNGASFTRGSMSHRAGALPTHVRLTRPRLRLPLVRLLIHNEIRRLIGELPRGLPRKPVL